MSFQSYPHDHPLWRDINFTPEWVCNRIQEQAAQNPAAANEPAEQFPGADQPWMEDEDSLLLFAQSEQGRSDGLSYQIVAGALGRTVGAVKSRWFREVRPWRDKQSDENVAAKLEQGKKLAVEKYKLVLRSLKS